MTVRNLPTGLARVHRRASYALAGQKTLSQLRCANVLGDPADPAAEPSPVAILWARPGRAPLLVIRPEALGVRIPADAFPVGSWCPHCGAWTRKGACATCRPPTVRTDAVGRPRGGKANGKRAAAKSPRRRAR